MGIRLRESYFLLPEELTILFINADSAQFNFNFSEYILFDGSNSVGCLKEEHLIHIWGGIHRTSKALRKVKIL